MRKAILLVSSVVLSSTAPDAKAFIHPGAPLDLADFAAVAADWTSIIRQFV